MSDGREMIPSYIAREKCGCVVGAVVDDPDHPQRTKEGLLEFVKDGLIIERVTVGWVREHGLEQCVVHSTMETEEE
ncbi:MAG: hypothetical protein C0391_03830 [Anaerolinea sp.]|nr:hypothetical protein [Anaerolinea sp.]